MADTGCLNYTILLGSPERHLSDSAVTRHSQHRFTKGKTNVIPFYGKVTYYWKVVGIVFLEFGKAYDTVPHSSLLNNLPRCEDFNVVGIAGAIT